MGAHRIETGRTITTGAITRQTPMFLRKVCRFCADTSLMIDYKDGRMFPSLLPTGQMLRAVTGIARASTFAHQPSTGTNVALLPLPRNKVARPFLRGIVQRYSHRSACLRGVSVSVSDCYGAPGVALAPLSPQPCSAWASLWRWVGAARYWPVWRLRVLAKRWRASMIVALYRRCYSLCLARSRIVPVLGITARCFLLTGGLSITCLVPGRRCSPIFTGVYRQVQGSAGS